MLVGNQKKTFVYSSLLNLVIFYIFTLKLRGGDKIYFDFELINNNYNKIIVIYSDDCGL